MNPYAQASKHMPQHYQATFCWAPAGAKNSANFCKNENAAPTFSKKPDWPGEKSDGPGKQLGIPSKKTRGNSVVVVTALWGDPACDAASAERFRVADLARQGRQLLQKCVAVTGVFKHRMLFDSTDDAQAYSAPDDIDHANERLGIYASEELGKTFPADMSNVSLIGNVGDCAELRDRKNVAMVSGYFHYSNGTYIAVSSFSATSMKP